MQLLAPGFGPDSALARIPTEEAVKEPTPRMLSPHGADTNLRQPIILEKITECGSEATSNDDY